MSQIVTINQMTGFVDTIVTHVKDNIAGILIVFGFIVGFSILLALIDTWKEQNYLNDRLSRRRHL